eukprot:404027_1
MSSDFIRRCGDEEWIENMISYCCGLIKNKMAFSDDILSLCWSYLDRKHGDAVMNTDLWKVILASCGEVIGGRDSNHWYWMKQYMLKSTIWLESDPSNCGGNGAFDGLLIQHLFYLANAQSMVNSERLKALEQKYSMKTW